MTPDAPTNSGTSFYKFIENNCIHLQDTIKKDCLNYVRKYNSDVTKWYEIDSIGNIFNRLIIYNSHYFHRATTYFGSDINDGRLFQVFFFDTEY